VSTDDQVRGYSLDHQRAVITAWCQREGIPLVGIEVADDGHGESGKDLDRPALRRVVDRIAGGDIGWVVVAKVDRLSRSLEDTCVLVEDWEQRQVILVAPEDGLDGRRGGSRTFLYLRSWMAEEERRRIVGRVGPGLLARAKAGLPLGRIPVGYQVVADEASGSDRSRRGRRLVPDPATGPAVTALFKRAAQSEWGARRLAAWAAANFPGHRFTYGQVSALLRNPVYLGTLTARVGDEDVLRLNNHEPLVSDDVFHAVQAKRRAAATEHAARERHLHATSWLGGIARCGHCGRSVSLWTDRAGVGHYQCQSRTRGAGCGAPRWIQDEMDTHVLDRLYAKLTQDLAEVSALVHDAIDQIPAFLDDQHAQATALLARSDGVERGLLENLERGTLSAVAFSTRLTEVRSHREAAQALMAQTDGYRFLGDLWKLRRHEPQRMHPEVARLLADEMRTRFPSSSSQAIRLWIPLPLVVAGMAVPDRRRLLRAAAATVTLMDDQPIPRVVMREGVATYGSLSQSLGRFMAQGHGIPVPTKPSDQRIPIP
jgi:site-specific DNA recombinase